jgi:predicted small lipoprotein YifL
MEARNLRTRHLIYTAPMNAVPHCRPVLRVCILAAVLGSTAACGLKGPLYLPDQKPDMVEVKTIPGVPTPSSQKKERSDSSKPSGSGQPAPKPPEQ